MNDIHKSPKTDKGFIYILSNASMPNIFKVGLTTNSVKQRIQELNSTGVPTTFELVKKYEIQESCLHRVERLAHKKLKSKEQHHGKEFRSTDINESTYGSTTTTIIMCKCSQRLRIPLGKHIDVTCPKCRRSFRIAT